MSNLILAPGEERELCLNVVPLESGDCALPRLRIFEEETGKPGQNEEEVTVKEWSIGVENRVKVLSNDLGTSPDERTGTDAVITQAEIKSFVLPR